MLAQRPECTECRITCLWAMRRVRLCLMLVAATSAAANAQVEHGGEASGSMGAAIGSLGIECEAGPTWECVAMATTSAAASLTQGTGSERGRGTTG